MSVTELAQSQMAAANYVNPFDNGNIVKAGRGSVADTQMATKELGEIQARVFLAKQFGRDLKTAYDKIMTACQREGLASVAVYSYARGGTNVTGPSIRLAEEIVRDWGNIDCGWMELERNAHESTLRAYAWDLETNSYKQITFVVPLQRTKRNRQGTGYVTVPLTDERDIYEMLASNAARRMRNCILTIIPGDIVEDAVAQCHRTLVTKCDITPERIKKMIAAFEPFGVTKQQIETRIQRKIESIAPAQFVKLMEIFNSLKDGMSEPADWFDPVETEQRPSASETLKETLKSTKRTSKKALPEPEPAPEPEPKPAPEQNLLDPAQEPEPTAFDRLSRQITQTSTKEGYKEVYDEINRALSAGEITERESETLMTAIEEACVE